MIALFSIELIWNVWLLVVGNGLEPHSLFRIWSPMYCTWTITFWSIVYMVKLSQFERPNQMRIFYKQMNEYRVLYDILYHKCGERWNVENIGKNTGFLVYWVLGLVIILLKWTIMHWSIKRHCLPCSISLLTTEYKRNYSSSNDVLFKHGVQL